LTTEKSRTEHLVSVVIPVYNGAGYLAEAVESVLSQSYRPIEVIVVDDGSTDESAEVARAYIPKVRYCYQPNGGTAASKNRGVQLAEGRFLAFLDADDLWEADKLSLQMAAFDADPQLDMVFGQMRHFISPDLDEASARRLVCPAELMPGYSADTMMIKYDSFLKVGLFDVQCRRGSFIDWYLKATDLSLKSVILPDLMARRRLHTTNHGIQKRNLATDYVRLLKRSLDRRRASALVGREGAIEIT